MARKLGPKCKRSRRIGTDLLLKSGVRDYKSKCKSDKTPGMHPNKARLSNYGRSLRAKQNLREYYGVLEKQFHSYYKKAARMKGSTGENLMALLESRLDNVVYRLGFASTRAEARQLVSHKAILVNEEVVNIPSYILKAGDKIEVRNRAKDQGRIKAALAISEQRAACDWLAIESGTMKGTYSSVPGLNDLPSEFNVNLVVEFYSK